MYKLRYSKASPYVRKIILCVHHLGLENKVTIENADTSDPQDTLYNQNPTGRIPVLIKQDGTSLYDSRVIMDFLERQSDKFLFPESGDARDIALTQAALGEGLIDSAILWVYAERYSGDQPVPELWRSHHQEKLKNGCDYLEQNISKWHPVEPYAGAAITLTACLGYLSFRNVFNWSEDRPALTKWYQQMALNLPGFDITAPDHKVN
ncbi:MAG: glutathione S-transferase [Alphaproteobacteria bacterium]|nr:glutathione S-transferase [Alphaproteobacteria bacterium]